jgi:MFS family permease
MLCEPKQRIGFLGACFFIGVLVASTIIPVGYLSDVIGRKWLFIGSIVVLQIACLGFIFATSLDQLYIFMFLIGITFPGRIIVGVNYAYELVHVSVREYI